MDTLHGIISRGICHSDSNYKEISQQQLQLGELELSHSHPCTVVVSSAKSIRICMMIIRAVWRRHLGVALHAGSGFFSSSSAVSCLVHRGVCPPRPSLSGVTFKWRHGPFIIICSLRLVLRSLWSQRAFNAIHHTGPRRVKSTTLLLACHSFLLPLRVIVSFLWMMDVICTERYELETQHLDISDRSIWWRMRILRMYPHLPIASRNSPRLDCEPQVWLNPKS